MKKSVKIINKSKNIVFLCYSIDINYVLESVKLIVFYHI